MEVNVNLMEENVSEINGGIIINVDASVRNIMYLKKIMFGILLHITMKMENIYWEWSMIQPLSVIKSYDKEIKTIPASFNEKEVTCKTQSL